MTGLHVNVSEGEHVPKGRKKIFEMLSARSEHVVYAWWHNAHRPFLPGCFWKNTVYTTDRGEVSLYNCISLASPDLNLTDYCICEAWHIRVQRTDTVEKLQCRKEAFPTRRDLTFYAEENIKLARYMCPVVLKFFIVIFYAPYINV